MFIIVLLIIIAIVIIVFYVTSKYANSKIFLNRSIINKLSDEGYQEIFVDGLCCYYWLRNPNSYTIFHCHSNFGNISYYDQIVRITKIQDMNLILFDYSGYGHSLGSPTQAQILRDGEKIYEYFFRHRIDHRKAIIWGESLGGAVASHLASKYKCKALVLLSTFTSLRDVVLNMNDWYYLSLLMTGFASTFSTMLSVRRSLQYIQCPVIIVHSEEDILIPVNQAHENFNIIPHSNKKLLLVSGTHSKPHLDNDKVKELFEFILYPDKEVCCTSQIVKIVDEEVCFVNGECF